MPDAIPERGQYEGAKVGRLRKVETAVDFALLERLVIRVANAGAPDAGRDERREAVYALVQIEVAEANLLDG